MNKLPSEVIAPASCGVYSPPKLQVYGAIVELTRSGTGSVADSRANKRAAVSDVAAKENVIEIGRHQLGFGLYLFDYRPEFRDACGQGRRFGVMAQEVEAIVPEAVSMGADGYRRVDYSKLGIVCAVN